MNELLRDTYAIVNLDQLALNYTSIKAYLPSNVKIACVVKGDAYGHGLSEVVQTLWEVGADYFAVACLSEGLVVRHYLPKATILIMGDVPESHLHYAIKAGLTLTLHRTGQGNTINQAASALNVQAHVHVKIDTGFNRLGFKNTKQAISEIVTCKTYEHLEIDGLYSHLALKDYDADDHQYLKLIAVQNELKKHNVTAPLCHIGDSIAAADLPEYHLDMVRTGALLYGLKSHNNNDIHIQSILTLVSHITRIENLCEGENISYGDSYQADKASTIATIPIGYGDGYPRNLSNKGLVKIQDNYYPIVGRICMDQCMVDITGASNITIGEEVILYDPQENSQCHISKIATLAETNKNELVARLSKRVPRLYIKNNRHYKTVDDILEVL